MAGNMSNAFSVQTGWAECRTAGWCGRRQQRGWRHCWCDICNDYSDILYFAECEILWRLFWVV